MRGERVDGHVGVLLQPSYGLHGLQVGANLLARARRGLRAVGLLLDQVGHQEHLLVRGPLRAPSEHAQMIAIAEEPIRVPVDPCWEGDVLQFGRLRLRALEARTTVQPIPLHARVRHERRLAASPCCAPQRHDCELPLSCFCSQWHSATC